MSYKEPKVMFFDIEVLSSMSADCGSVCSMAYKYLGKKKVHSLAISDYSNYDDDVFDDTELLKDIHFIISDADVIIGHYSKGFDLPFLNTRFILNGLPPITHKPHVDTYFDMAKRKLSFRSRKLKNLAYALKLPEKKNPMDFPRDWNAVIVKKPGAMRKMVTYNKQDVIVLELVYEKLKAVCVNHPHLGLIAGHNKKENSCPYCASFKTKIQSYYTTLRGKQCVRHCNECGKNWKAESALGDKDTHSAD